MGLSMTQEQVYSPACEVLRGPNVRVIVVICSTTKGGGMEMELVGFTGLLSELRHWRCTSLLVTAMHVRVSVVPDITGLS